MMAENLNSLFHRVHILDRYQNHWRHILFRVILQIVGRWRSELKCAYFGDWGIGDWKLDNREWEKIKKIISYLKIQDFFYPLLPERLNLLLQYLFRSFLTIFSAHLSTI